VRGDGCVVAFRDLSQGTREVCSLCPFLKYTGDIEGQRQRSTVKCNKTKFLVTWISVWTESRRLIPNQELQSNAVALDVLDFRHGWAL
jgi:hypothetical protein